MVEMLDQATAFYEGQAQESARKARLAMIRAGVIAALALGGAAYIVMEAGYANILRDIMHWAD